MNKFSVILGIQGYESRHSKISWVCRDGRRIPLSEMKDDHLRNTLAYLVRNDRQLDSKFSSIWQEIIDRDLNMGTMDPNDFTKMYEPTRSWHWSKK